jgi:Concanavalin A-like lectin/glucanases superfamily
MRRLVLTAVLLGLALGLVMAQGPFPPGIPHLDRTHPLLQKADVWLPVLPTHTGGSTWWNVLGTTHGILTNGALWASKAPSRFDGYVLLDGIDDYVDLPDTPAVSFERTDPMTLALSVNLTAVVRAVLVAKANTASPFEGIWFLLEPDGTVSCSLVTPVEGMGLQTTGVVTAGFWQTVVCTYDGSATEAGIRLYINGIQQATTTYWGSPTIADSILVAVPMRLGADNDGLIPLPGWLSNVLVCHCTWSAAQAKAYEDLRAPWYGGMFSPQLVQGTTLAPPAPRVKRKVTIQ